MSITSVSRFHLSAICSALLIAMFVTSSAQADDSLPVTVALLLPTQSADGMACCLDDPVAIVFSGPEDSGGGVVPIGSAAEFGEFSGAGLLPVNAAYITRGGISRSAVYTVSQILPSSQHGVIVLGPNSDAEIEYCGFVTFDGNALYPDSAAFATDLLVIISAELR